MILINSRTETDISRRKSGEKEVDLKKVHDLSFSDHGGMGEPTHNEWYEVVDLHDEESALPSEYLGPAETVPPPVRTESPAVTDATRAAGGNGEGDGEDGGNHTNGWPGVITVRVPDAIREQRSQSATAFDASQYYADPPSMWGAFVGSLWDSTKRWDNAEVAESYGEHRDSGYGRISAGLAAFGASVGERAGIGLIEDARSGRSAEGDQLGFWERTWRGTLGVGAVTMEAIGIKAAPKVAKQAIEHSKTVFDYVRTGIGNLLPSRGGGPKAKAFPEPDRALVPQGAKPMGDWGEARLRNHLGVADAPKTKFKTSDGTREIDVLLNGIAHESKAGVNVSLTAPNKRQILKDKELIQERIIDGAHWHFWQSADQSILDFLRQHGIPYTVH